MQVVLATITRGDVRMEYMQSVFDAFTAGKFSYLIMQEGGHYLDDARNAVVERALNECGDFDWLLFCDDDQTFTAANFDTLFEKATPDHKVIAGWYLTTFKGITPCVFQWGPHERYGEHFNAVTVADIREAERDDQGYVPVDATGTGFMAIRRELLIEMRDRYSYPCTPFAELPINGVNCGEDLTFCSRVRQMGYGVFIHPDVNVGHVKTLELKET